MKTDLAILSMLLSTVFGGHGTPEEGACHSNDNSCDNVAQTYSFADDGTHFGGYSGSNWEKITKSQYDWFTSKRTTDAITSFSGGKSTTWDPF